METEAIRNEAAEEFAKVIGKRMLKETLKYAAGKQMFCHNCSVILDWKKTVVITASKGDRKATLIVCRDCFKPSGIESLIDKGFTIEIDKWD